MSSRTLFDFTPPQPDSSSEWETINDDVMGGRSESSFASANGAAAFTGTVSLKNGGGFASVRAPESSWDLGEAGGIQLRVRGDGRRYWFTMYTEPGGPISYRATFQPPEDWTTVMIPFSSLTPYRRGEEVPDAPSFDPTHVRTLGVLIADGQAGPFQLEVAWIREEPDPVRS